MPDEAKIELLDYLLSAGKHVLVEKPLLSIDDADLIRLGAVAEKTGAVCYTAYNHRFEPHFVRMADLIKSGRLGKIYSLRMFYGNGTARLVRDSAWRDQGAGVLPDLGSHLLDTLRFWLGQDFDARFRVRGAYRHENRSFDHVVIDTADGLAIQLEYVHFKTLCAEAPGTNGLANDLWINRTLRDLAAQAGVHDMVREGAGA